MAAKNARPISPHLMHVRWPVPMMVSIIHRITGDGMATVGTVLLVWWLAALSSGKDSYAAFVDLFTTHDGHLNIVGWVLGVGLSFAFFQHMASGIRHLVMDTGAAFELKTNKLSAIATFVVSVTATILFWVVLKGIK